MESLISSTQNPKIKSLLTLQQKSSERRKTGLFVVEGRRELEHCIEAGYEVECLFVNDDLRLMIDEYGEKSSVINPHSSFINPHSSILIHHSSFINPQSTIYPVSPHVYERIAYRGSTEGIVAVVHAKRHTIDDLRLMTDEYDEQSSVLNPHSSVITHHSSVLNPHSSVITHHSSVLSPHSSVLSPHSSVLSPHSSVLSPHSSVINPHSSVISPHSSVINPHSSVSSPHSSIINHHSSIHSPLYIVLESVEKPGNLGAVLRSADAAAADAVIVCDPLTDLYNPNLIRASIGAVFSVPVATCTSEECIAWLKAQGIRILTAQLQDSKLYYDTDMCAPTAIVMGTESTGLTEPWRQAADAHIRIPMLGKLDSLNVSVSAAILLFEAVRQRQNNT